MRVCHCCWLLISDSVSLFLPNLISFGVFLFVKAAKEEKGGKAEREDIFSISTLFHLGFSHGYSVVRNLVLNYLRTAVSPKSGVEIY